MALAVSAAFPPGIDTPDHVARAVALGFGRAWRFDSPPGRAVAYRAHHERAGAAGVAYRPAGPDIERALRAFAGAAGL